MLDQRFTISNKLCSEKITKQKRKSTKCQKQNKSLNNNMLYNAILLMLIIATAYSQEMNGQTQNYETSGTSSFVQTNEISEDCAPAAMSRCTDPLKVVTDNRDLGFATSMDELQEMCPKLMEGLRCIDDFTVRCLDREHRAYFNTLYAGTTQVIVDLCQEGSYQSDYLRHAPCMRQVQSGYERCASEYQQRIKSLNSGAGDHVQGRSEEYGEYADYEYEYEEDGSKKRRKKRQAPTVHDSHDYESHEMEGHVEDGEESVQLLCCSFQKYLHCSESVVNTTCGYETARFTKSFLDRMSGPLIQGHCQAYEYGSEGCRMTTGGDPWDEYNQGYQSPQSFSSATKNYPSLYFNIMSFSSIVTLYTSAILPLTLSFILHAI